MVIFIYQNTKGWYSVSDEAFYNPKMKLLKILIVKKVLYLLLNRQLNGLRKSLIFFRLSKWEKPLLDFYEKNPNFIAS